MSNETNKLIPELRFTEFLNDREWREDNLGNITRVVSTRNKENKKLPIYSINNKEGFLPQNEQFEGINSSDRGYDISLYKVIERNTFAYNPARIDVGSIGYSGELNNVIISSLYVCFQTAQDIDDKFLWHFFNSFYFNQSVKNNVEGGIRNYLFYENFSKIKIAVPTIQEQQKIAYCLTSLDEVITAHSKKLEALKDHKKGLMQNLFPQEGETVPKYRFPEFANAGEWIQDTLKNIAKFRRGSFPQPYGLPEWLDKKGFPFIQVYDVGEDFRLKPTTKTKISQLAADQSVFIKKGTVIITIQGSIGKVAITQYDAYIDRTLLLFEELYNEIDKTFFAYVLFLLFEIEKQKAPGGIIKTITKEVLSDFVIKFPEPEEQKRIAECLSCLDALISAQTDKLEQLKLHKNGLMQGLFPKIND